MYGCRHVPQLTLATREKHTGSPCLNNAPECPVPGLEPRGKIPRSQTVEASIEAIVVLPPQSMESSTHPWQRQSCHLDGLVRFDLEASPLSCRDMDLASTEVSCPGFSAVRCIDPSPMYVRCSQFCFVRLLDKGLQERVQR
jgi:hypothetical protein